MNKKDLVSHLPSREHLQKEEKDGQAASGLHPCTACDLTKKMERNIRQRLAPQINSIHSQRDACQSFPALSLINEDSLHKHYTHLSAYM